MALNEAQNLEYFKEFLDGLDPKVIEENAKDFNLSSTLESATFYLDCEKQRGLALEVLVILSRIKSIWNTDVEKCDVVIEKLMNLFFENKINQADKICCLRCLANIPLQNQARSSSHFASHSADFVKCLNNLQFDVNFEQFIFFRILVLGTIVSKNFKDEISAHVQIIFDCAEKAFKVQKLSFKNEIIFELSKLIYACFCVESVNSDEKQIENMKILIQSLFVFIEESERKRELIDKVIQLSERLPGSVLKSAFDLPMKKSVEMVNRYPKLELILDEFSRQMLMSSTFDMLATYLKVICQLMVVSRHARKVMKKRLRLPDRDYFQLPNDGDTLSSKIISLFTNPDIIVKTLSAQLFFIVAKQNVQRFIDITGYGNAAGLLYQNGFLTKGFQADESEADDFNSSDDDDQEREKRVVEQAQQMKKEKKYVDPVMNPITGRLEEAAIQNKFANLTPEQKEYEAHKLAEIFSKMSSGALRPMAIDKNGKLTPVDQMAHETVLDKEGEEETDED